MLVRFRTLAVSSLLFAAACAAPTPGDPDAPGDPGQASPVPLPDQNATSLGVSIMSSDAQGRPRLIRSIVSRTSVAGTAPVVAARDHVAALASLWVKQSPPTSLVVFVTVEPVPTAARVPGH